MEKIVVELDVNSKKGVEEVNGLSKKITDLGKDADKTTRNVSGGTMAIGKSAKSSATGVGILSKGFYGLGIAIKASGIGLLLGALAAVTDLMKNNQKVLDAFSTGMNFISVAFRAVTTSLSETYKTIVTATNGFEALGKIVKGLITISLAPLKLIFYELKQAMDVLKVGYESMFGDDASVLKAKADLAQTRLDILDVASGAIKAGIDVSKNIGKAVKDVQGAIGLTISNLSKIDPKELLETADAMTTLKNNAEIAAAVQAGLVEKYDRLAEKQRQIRDEERNSIADRKKANDELLIILEKQEKAMLKAADAQIADAQAQLLANNNQENRIKLIDAENNKLGVKAQITGLLSEQKVNDLGLDREQIALDNLKGESDSRLNIEKQKFAADQILNEQMRLQSLIEINELEGSIEATRLQAIIDNANAGTQAKVDAQIALDDFNNTNGQENITLKKELGLQEVKDAQAVADAKLAIQNANLNNISGGIGLLKQLAGKSQGLQAAALIAESAASVAKTIISTQAANAVTFAQGAALAIPSFGASTAIAASLVAANNVSAGISVGSQIAATVAGLSSLGGGSAPSRPSTPSAPNSPSVGGLESTPPSFNIVGQSDTNQLADAIGGQSQQPTRAYVVSGDVTTSQSLDRNIIDGASI